MAGLGLSWSAILRSEVLRKAGLHAITDYIGQRRTHIVQKISARPVLEECRGAERQRGTTRRQYWWEQDLDMELPPLEGRGDDTDEL